MPEAVATRPALLLKTSVEVTFRARSENSSGHRRPGRRHARRFPGALAAANRGSLLLLFPERQQALRCLATDDAGDTNRDLAEGCRRDAAERDRADADLAPEVEVAP